MTLHDELAQLRTENAALAAQVAALEQQLAAALARIAELEQQRHDPPPFVKTNRPKPDEPKRPRKKRAAEHNRGRRCEPPTRTESHALAQCPDCHYPLRGTSMDYRRQVIDLPPPQPVEVIEHQVIKRFCPSCQRWHSPTLDLTGQVFGQGRIGVRVASLIAFLSLVLRVPVRRIQAYLRTLHQLTISTGEIVELLHQVRRTLQGDVAALKQQARASPILHGDETGWRENGQNGYLWAFSTPGEDAVRYYEYDASRGQHGVRRILGGQFKGHLVSDFYCGYNGSAGKHQRCWVHLLRDLHALKEAHARDAEVLAWATAVRALYDEAQDWLKKADPQPTNEAREQQYVALTARAHALGLQFARAKKHACQALAKRLLRHEDELFQFVLVAGLSADNNLAERSIRPLVVIRKISGGSRSPEGTKTRMALASLFETWQARGLNPFDECYRRLSQAAAS
ncbi:MAG: IS66 family transposase [Oscillochloris sp.]|nr:IS66 family transposase [Oscillochloris sp.]